MTLREWWWVYRQHFEVHGPMLRVFSAVCGVVVCGRIAWGSPWWDVAAMLYGAWVFYSFAVFGQVVYEGRAYLNAAREWLREEDLP